MAVPPWRSRIRGLSAGCLEGSLRLLRIGRATDAGDPFVGFSEVVPLFKLNDSRTRYEIARSRQVFFRPDSFRANKAPNEFRIFCFGGSTVQGRPYAIETSFTTWLELTLRAADPTRDWEVVNCGGVSYASYRLLPVMKETLSYEPDLFIVYSGHNEFLEDRSYSGIKSLSPWMKGALETAFRFHLFNAARSVLGKNGFADSAEQSTQTKANLPKEVDALLDHRGGLERYHRDDEWHRGVVEHYELNLRRMIRMSRDASVPIVLANPTSNVRDTPPFKAELDAATTDAHRVAFEKAWEFAKQCRWDDLGAKLDAVDAVLQLEPRHCEALFLRAKILESMGSVEAAKEHYLRAKDEDLCPLRMTEAMHDAVLRVAQQTNTPLVDVRKLFDSLAEFNLPGDALLIDHVHPHIEGHQRIAELLYKKLVDLRFVRESPGFDERRKQLFDDNYGLLPGNYFPEALSRLDGLTRWAQGRAGQFDPEPEPVELSEEN